MEPVYAVVFTRADTLLSWLIQFRTRGAVSHCGFLVQDSSGVRVYQAGGPGVSVGGLSLYLGQHRRIVKVIQVQPAPGAAAAGLATAQKYVGDRYGIWPDVEIALGLSGNWDAGTLNCSEYCGLIVHAMGVQGVRYDAGVTPAELLASMNLAGCKDISAAYGVKPEPPAKHVFGGM